MSDIEQPNIAQDKVYATGVMPVSVLNRARFIFAAAAVILGAISTLVWAVFLGWCVVDVVHHFWQRDATLSRFTEWGIIRSLREQNTEATTADMRPTRLAAHLRQADGGATASPCLTPSACNDYSLDKTKVVTVHLSPAPL
jgi:hypothetical protein